jgi:CheY-like chemotaxis protein
LSGILGYAQLLRREGGLSEAQYARVNAMLSAGKHLLEMISCVLDLSEIEAERVELRAVKVDVRAIAAACLDLVRPAAETKRLALSIVAPLGTNYERVIDPVRVRQVLFNLLGNAVKFTWSGAIELRLRTDVDGCSLRIEVADTGPGIPAMLRERLFQDFERLDIEASSSVEGAGLGLALSARLATLIGGRLGHDDNAGGGSVFWLELPSDAGVSPTLLAPSFFAVPDGETAPVSARVLHVLVVDDIAMNRDNAASFLQAAGHKVTCVEGGRKAIEAVARADFDVVLMDVRMPEMDGLEATRRIRALEGARGLVPIVAVTAPAFIDKVEECHNAGMHAPLAKPFDPDTSMAAVVYVAGARAGVAMGFSLVATPYTAPAASLMIGSELAVVNARAFDRTASFLTPEAVTSYLQTIAARGKAIMRGLREPDALTNAGSELAKAAHVLAGSAGMFGFERLTCMGLRFERAIQSGTAEVPALAEGLNGAIVATLQEIRARTPNIVPA